MNRSRYLGTLLLCAVTGLSQAGIGCDGNRKASVMHNKSNNTERVDQSVHVFAKEKKGWQVDQYRIDHKPARPDGKLVVHLIYLDDLRSSVPSGGQSMELFLDPNTFEVTETFRFQ
jgi:hypothetical protein